jgi:hypothetical protein
VVRPGSLITIFPLRGTSPSAPSSPESPTGDHVFWIKGTEHPVGMGSRLPRRFKEMKQLTKDTGGSLKSKSSASSEIQPIKLSTSAMLPSGGRSSGPSARRAQKLRRVRRLCRASWTSTTRLRRLEKTTLQARSATAGTRSAMILSSSLVATRAVMRAEGGKRCRRPCSDFYFL